ncbi:TPA: HD domain-containing protein [Candidatus Poribacteria bacterium]|nr:HD domain-containing protein [Candidatus Poribacteria bacterium]
MKKTLTKERIDQLVPDLETNFIEQKEGISQFIKEQRESLESLIKNPRVGGFEICRYNTAIFDVVVKKIYEIAIAKVGIEPNIAIFASGGYGRRELCYLSDIDLCYTSDVDLEEGYDEDTLRFIRVFYNFIDAFRVLRDIVPRFSFIYRPYCDAPEWNHQDLTALLDGRFLVGNRDLMDGLRETIKSEMACPRALHCVRGQASRRDDISVIFQLLASRDEHFKKTGDTIYMNQPDIKSGRGGLRDIQFALWIKGIKDFVPITTLYEEKMADALDFILKVRNLLHFTAAKFTDVLSYNPENQDYTQLRIAELMGYEGAGEQKVYALMSDYYGYAKKLHLEAELIIGKTIETGIKISNHLAVKESKIYCIDGKFEQLTEDELFAIFEYFQQYDFEIDANLGAYLASLKSADFSYQRFNVGVGADVQAGSKPAPTALTKRFINLFSLGGRVSKAIRRMHRLGIIEHLLPEFERSIRIRSERPTDPYTVGKHSMEAVANLDDIRNAEEQGELVKSSKAFSASPNRIEEAEEPSESEIKLLHDIYLQIADPSALYFALLMHDFDKPGKDHAITGARKIREIASSLGFNIVQIEEIEFLLKEHLTMINIARYHPLNDAIIEQFQKSVGSVDRLNKLYLLTYCDSKANGRHNFSAVDKDNLRRLYELTHERFLGKDDRALYAAISPERINQFLSRMPVTYRMSHGNIDEIIFHLKLVETVEKRKDSLSPSEVSPVIVEFVDKTGFTELHFCCPDRVGLINQITGAFYAYDIDVREASIYTKEDTSIALDTFKLVYKPRALREIQPSPLSEELKREIKRVITELMNGNTSLDAIFAHRGVKAPDGIRIFNISVEKAKETYSEIVVEASDRDGFLYLFSGILADLGLNIEMSKCSTLGGTVTNRFYVTPIECPKRIEAEIIERLRTQPPQRVRI